jgi:hypothetical protein
MQEGGMDRLISIVLFTGSRWAQSSLYLLAHAGRWNGLLDINCTSVAADERNHPYTFRLMQQGGMDCLTSIVLQWQQMSTVLPIPFGSCSKVEWIAWYQFTSVAVFNWSTQTVWSVLELLCEATTEICQSLFADLGNSFIILHVLMTNTNL